MWVRRLARPNEPVSEAPFQRQPPKKGPSPAGAGSGNTPCMAAAALQPAPLRVVVSAGWLNGGGFRSNGYYAYPKGLYDTTMLLHYLGSSRKAWSTAGFLGGGLQ